MVVVDRMCNGVALLASELFIDPAPGNWHYSSYNLNNVPTRYRILYDKAVVLRQAAGANIPVGIYRRFLIRFKGLRIQYNDGNAGTVADIQKNAVYILAFTDWPLGANQPLIGTEFQVKWKDG